jgi:hypothetical protein
LGAFWRGELPLAQAFWAWGILGGAAVNLLATLLAAMLLVLEAPAWTAALAFAAPIPWNFALVAGVWRSAGRAPHSGRADLARVAILVWAILLCVV